MQVGIHYDKSFGEYASWDAINNSKLGWLKKSPMHFKYNVANPRKDTKDLALGRAVHTALLEPDKFNSEFYSLPKVDARTKEGKALKESLARQNVGKQELDQETYETAFAMAKAILLTPNCPTLLEDTAREVSVVWKDLDFLCKGRIDAWDKHNKRIVDIKTTKDASPSGFASSIFSYGYYRQAAWYMKALEYFKEPVKEFVIIAVEKEPPYAVGIYKLDIDAIVYGTRENEELLALYKRCVTRNEWSTYTTEVQDISLPYYALKNMEELYGKSTRVN